MFILIVNTPHRKSHEDSYGKRLIFLSRFRYNVKFLSLFLCRIHNYPKEKRAFCPSMVNMFSGVMMVVAVSIS